MLPSFPEEYQVGTKDCGPTCVKIIAKYYGRDYCLDYLKSLCCLTKDGVNLLNLEYACKMLGLQNLSLKLTWRKFKEKVPLPCIIHWNNSHFIVVYHILDIYPSCNPVIGTTVILL